jgi:CheY-like chemotaxis protein
MTSDETGPDQNPETGPLSRSEIVELMQLWQQAEQAASQTRNQLMAALSRGIRGPVSHISGAAGLLQDSHMNGEQREGVNAIQSAADNLMKLVEQLQGVSQAHAEATAQGAPPVAAAAEVAPNLENPYAGVHYGHLQSVRVLVADDDPTARTLAARMLQRIGYESDVVEDGLQAVQAVQDKPYCAVLMDCQMPRMDGYQATRTIRQLTGREGEVPVIALTANAMEGDDMACMVAGMDDYLAKPVNPKKLAEVLAKWAKTA